MARPIMILMDQLHLALLVPRGLPKKEYTPIRRVLRSPAFHSKLHRAIRDVLRRYPSLRKVRTTLTS